MIDDRVTLKLKGTVPLDLFATAISALSTLIRTLSHEVSGDSQIEWVVEDLSGGSAEATIVGQSTDLAGVERVVKSYGEVGRALSEKTAIPYSDSVKQAAFRMTSVLNGHISAATLGTRKQHWIVASETAPTNDREGDAPGGPVSGFGTVEGVVHTLTDRQELKFTLYDALYDRAVVCRLEPGQHELMRGIWGKDALVQGWVTRDPITGRPTSIRKITAVTPVIHGDYRRARGVLRRPGSDELPEATIRRLRDAN